MVLMEYINPGGPGALYHGPRTAAARVAEHINALRARGSSTSSATAVEPPEEETEPSEARASPPPAIPRKAGAGGASSSSSARAGAAPGAGGGAQGNNVHCSNTCKTANDGTCDEGRMHAYPIQRASTMYPMVPVTCDLGTDCGDCGPWVGRYSESWLRDAAMHGPRAAGGPISYLLSRKLTLQARRTSLSPSFLMLVTDTDSDHDLSLSMLHMGVVEGGITGIFTAVLKQCLQVPAGSSKSSRLVVDVGGNFGYFSLMSAANKCRVVAFEPVPMFRAFFEWGVAVNGLNDLITLHPFVAGDVAGGEVTLEVPVNTTWGIASVGGINLPEKAWGIRIAHESVPAKVSTVDSHVDEDVLMLKVDVEGYEPRVMQGAKGLFAKRDVQNVVMEYSPTVAEVQEDKASQVAHPAMLYKLATSGYQVAHLENGFSKGWYGARQDVPLPPMQQISAESLRYDMRDVELYQKGLLGCPVPERLKPYGGWSDCNDMRADASPYSFRTLFWYNTNIWATKQRALMPLEPEGAGVADPAVARNLSASGWLAKALAKGKGHAWMSGTWGLFALPCDRPTMGPNYWVRYRCPCPQGDPYSATCEEELKVVEELNRQGLMPSSYQLPPV